VLTTGPLLDVVGVPVGMAVDPFRNYKTEEVWERDAKLSSLFRPPLEVMHRGSIEEARSLATSGSRWLLIVVGQKSDFDFHRLNRDVWQDATIQGLIRKSFVFCQHDSASHMGMLFLTTHKRRRDVVHTCVVDPITNQLMWAHEGFCARADMKKHLVDFLQQNKECSYAAAAAAAAAAGPTAANAAAPFDSALDVEDLTRDGDDDDDGGGLGGFPADFDDDDDDGEVVDLTVDRRSAALSGASSPQRASPAKAVARATAITAPVAAGVAAWSAASASASRAAAAAEPAASVGPTGTRTATTTKLTADTRTATAAAAEAAAAAASSTSPPTPAPTSASATTIATATATATPAPPTPTAATATEAAAPAVPASPGAGVKWLVPAEPPASAATARLSLQLPTGRRLVRTFLLAHCVGHVRAFAAAEMPSEHRGRPFLLLRPAPRAAVLADDAASLDKAGVANCLLRVEFKD
jgi:hypothetical protein